MGNLSKILGGLLVIALIYIIFLKGCGGLGGSGNEIITSDTVYIEIKTTDTIIERIPVEKIVLKYIRTNVPVPYLDTTSSKLEEFDNFIKERPMVYQDTISDDTVMIHYRIRTWGFVDKIDIGYGLKNKYYIKEKVVIEKITTIQTEVTPKKQFNGFYFGVDVGFIKDSVSHVMPVLEASFNRFNCNIGYDLMDKDIVAGVRIKLGK